VLALFRAERHSAEQCFESSQFNKSTTSTIAKTCQS
jgi:hypothetical protein